MIATFQRLSLENIQPVMPRKLSGLNRVAYIEIDTAHQGILPLARKYSRSDFCRREKNRTITMIPIR